MSKKWILGSGIILLFLLALVSIAAGAVPIAPRDIISGLTDPNSRSYFIVHEVRLPRTLVAIAAGSGLAVAGAILQTILRNHLASPDVIGITQGASFAAVSVIFLFPAATATILPAAAFGGALLSLAILILISRRLTLAPATLALVGVAVGSIFQAGVQYYIVTYPTNVNMALLWMSGSLWGRGWEQLRPLAPLLLLMLTIAIGNAKKLNILEVGDAISISLGLLVRRERLWLLLLSVCLAGASVSAVGAIGFIGLLAPHIARTLVGTQNQWRLPMAAVIGAILIVLGDIVGRIIIIPREVPAGIVTSVIGAPYFIYLLQRARRIGRH